MGPVVGGECITLRCEGQVLPLHHCVYHVLVENLLYVASWTYKFVVRACVQVGGLVSILYIADKK